MMSSHFHPPRHAHGLCIKRAKSRALDLLESSGKKFGANQLLVLEALLEDHKAVSAYGIVERIARVSNRLQPVQVYRALDALLELNLVHKLQSKNAYFACSSFDECNSSQLLYCSSCEQVAEIADDTVSQLIKENAQKNNFKLEQSLVEIIGLCPECHSTPKS